MTIEQITAVAAIFISLGALSIASLALRISYLVYHRDEREREPYVSATVRAVAGQTDWYEVKIRLESRTSHGYRGGDLRFVRPWRARGIRHEQAREKSGVINPLPRDIALRRISTRLSVTGAGTQPGMRGTIRMSDGAHHEETFFVYAPSIWSRTLSMRLSLSSTEAIVRNTEVPIIRTLPQAVKTAAA